MRLPVDDEIYNVDAVWLGPPGKTLPFRARYVAYAIGAVIFFLLQVIERRLGIGFGFFPLAYSLLATAALTRLVLAFVDHDRPVLTVVHQRADGTSGHDRPSDDDGVPDERRGCTPSPPASRPKG